MRYKVVVEDRGRVVLPPDVQSALNLEPGTPMLLSTEADGSVRLRSYRAVAERNRAALASIAPDNESLVDELLAERRQEVARENAE